MTSIFREVFSNPNIMLHDDLTASDIEGWDSIKHVALIVAIEKAFNLSFKPREIISLKKHIDIEKLVESKLKIHGT